MLIAASQINGGQTIQTDITKFKMVKVMMIIYKAIAVYILAEYIALYSRVSQNENFLILFCAA